MKNVFTLIVVFFAVHTLNAQAFFFSTYRPKENGLKYDCQNAKDYTLKQIADYKEYQTLSSDFNKSHNWEWPHALFLKADKPFIIYKGTSVRKWENCTYTFIDCAQANTLEEVKGIIKKRRTEHKFDNELILYTLNPNQKVSDKNVIEKNYGDLYVKLISGNKTPSQFSVAQFKNHSTDQAFVVALRWQHKEMQIIELQPQASTAINLNGNTDYTLEVYTKKPNEKIDNIDWLDYVKEKIRANTGKGPDYKETIEVRENLIKSPTTVTGVRG